MKAIKWLYKVCSFLKKAQLTGEYWLHDGQSEYADGDIGDYNHEMIAFDYFSNIDREDSAFSGIEINAGYIDWNGLAQRYASENGKEEPNNSAETKQYALAYLADNGANIDFFKWELAGKDLREYAVNQGWIRVKGNQFQLTELTDQNLRYIQNHIADILSEDEYESTEIYIEEWKTKNYFYVPADVIMRDGVTAAYLKMYSESHTAR